MRARARAAMSIVSWDKFLAAGWAPLACWSFCHGVEHEVHSLVPGFVGCVPGRQVSVRSSKMS
jgi:hypothetical protein